MTDKDWVKERKRSWHTWNDNILYTWQTSNGKQWRWKCWWRSRWDLLTVGKERRRAGDRRKNRVMGGGGQGEYWSDGGSVSLVKPTKTSAHSEWRSSLNWDWGCVYIHWACACNCNREVTVSEENEIEKERWSTLILQPTHPQHKKHSPCSCALGKKLNHKRENLCLMKAKTGE